MAEEGLQPADVVAVGLFPECRGKVSHSVDCHPLRIHPGTLGGPLQRLGYCRATNGRLPHPGPVDPLAAAVYIARGCVGCYEQGFIVGRRHGAPGRAEVVPDGLPHRRRDGAPLGLAALCVAQIALKSCMVMGRALP